MELLLLLTALFASLTGTSGEQPGAVRQGVAVVRSAQGVQAAVQPARRAIPASVMPAILARPERSAPLRLAAAPLRSIALVFERRLE
ncbi:hypothetical protein P1X14_19085 [Sphingomonas sp. AOB5]|uniref:hypothetical protein n=1 Tax=Sphingomonas sp. AOB5 TaxID=3034017 RepID=UPI0023F69720|nr:hypothetical protein [Sphingomonas sp. AOB5]MDF7777370.1 hypothetical protein [Sphingomonas sp. AOB5]